MTPSADYPRMMFHRTLPWVIVQSREEEDALGPGWARTVLPAGDDPPAEPVPASAPEPAAAKKKEARGRASGPHARS
jgi:hypothetical protein